MILLDTNAIIWLVTRHRRGRPLLRETTALAISPASILELGLLADIGRLRLRLQDVVEDDRWSVDDPPAAEWFARAADEAWTRDPFDRLIVAHARLRRARLATGDTTIGAHLRPSEVVAL
jgi:PIN domain nuclease of toxin-antitoxin system